MDPDCVVPTAGGNVEANRPQRRVRLRIEPIDLKAVIALAQGGAKVKAAVGRIHDRCLNRIVAPAGFDDDFGNPSKELRFPSIARRDDFRSARICQRNVVGFLAAENDQSFASLENRAAWAVASFELLVSKAEDRPTLSQIELPVHGTLNDDKEQQTAGPLDESLYAEMPRQGGIVTAQRLNLDQFQDAGCIVVTGTMLETDQGFAQLLASARGGDRSALDELTRQYEPKLRLAARVLLGPALRPYVDSVDLVQSVHKSLLVGLRDEKFAIHAPENLRALALTLVRRKVARKWRRLKRQERHSGETATADDLPNVLVAMSRPQDDPAQAAQFRDQVAHLCQNLNDAERRLVELRWLGFSPAECAAELGLSPVAFRVRLTRLRQRLRAAGLLDDWL